MFVSSLGEGPIIARVNRKKNMKEKNQREQKQWENFWRIDSRVVFIDITTDLDFIESNEQRIVVKPSKLIDVQHIT